jgi:DNA-binding PadR family transcriptional regulator
MADDQELDKVPKTQLILSLLAEQGPKTEYDLYKQLPKLSHGTIHFCLTKLVENGAITYTKVKLKNKQTKKEYHLTFIGTVCHIASYQYWQTEFTDSQLEDHLKEFDQEEQEEIIEFLYRQGKLLKYAIFEESHWLAERYPGIANVLTLVAYHICEHPPQPYKNLLWVAAAEIQASRHLPIIERKAEKESPSHQDMIEQLQDAYRRKFNRLFFESILIMKHNSKATTNLRLQRLAQEELEEEKHEASILELAIQLFGRQAKTK